MKVSQKKRKFTSSSPTQKYLNTLKTTKNTKLKMLITSKVVVKKSND